MVRRAWVGKRRNQGSRFTGLDALMQCYICKKYRHDGPCEPDYDKDLELEMLEIAAEQAQARYQAALEKAKDKDHGHS